MAATDAPTFDLADADAVRDRFLAGARANREATCRVHSIDRITPPGRLIATGDLHDNPIHYARLLRAAKLADDSPADDPDNPTHLVLHEIIHPDRLLNGMDFSYRALARVADLKARHPERVHVLLGNHELAQMIEAPVIKDGVRCLEAFAAGLDYVFADDALRVSEAIKEFIRSMPIALRCVTPKGDILVAHSLPPAAMMGRFDTTLLTRDLIDDDYRPRTGAAHIMVWGRGYDAELLEDLVERWGVNLFILGHEKVEHGIGFTPPNAIVLNSDHAKGVYLPIDLAHPPRPEAAMEMAISLAGAE